MSESHSSDASGSPGPRSARERALELGRHYIRDAVYAANDGILTTFAIVAAVRGAEMSSTAALVLGVANLVADGLSMGAGNYLGIKSERATESNDVLDEWDETVHGLKHAAVTFVCFALLGAVPLLPFLVWAELSTAFWASAGATCLSLFGVGSARTLVTRRSAWRSGLEMLLVGMAAGGAAYGIGWAVDRLIDR